MLHFAFIFGSCLLLPRVIALQITAVQNSRVFVSRNMLWCGQARSGMAEEALCLFKSMPRAKLFDGVAVSASGNLTCADIGYHFSAGEDACYPGLETFHRSEKEKQKHRNDLHVTLLSFGTGYNFTSSDTNLLDSCKCKAGSRAMNLWGEKCHRVKKLQAMVETHVTKPKIIRTFVSKNKLWCGQGEVDIAENALNLYQSMPRGKLYEGVTVMQGKSCKQLGYNMTIGDDACYPGLTNFYRTEKEKNKFMDEFYGTLFVFGKEYDINIDNMSMLDACRCKENSRARNYWGGNCTHADQLLTRVSKPKVIRTFLSKDKMWCGQAEAHVAEDALNLYKSMPRGMLYDGITVSRNKSCAELGYTVEMGQDPCYPGLRNFYRTEEEKHRFVDNFYGALFAFGQKYDMNMNDTTMLDACRCKDGSNAKAYWGDSCTHANKLQIMVETLADKHIRTFVSKNKLWCGQAQVSVAENSLKLYKSMPRGMLYEGITISKAKSCIKLGYKIEMGEDPCYPGLKNFYRKEEDKHRFMDDFYSALFAFGKKFDMSMNDTTMLDACRCKDGSNAKAYWGDNCTHANKLQTLVESQMTKRIRTFVSKNKLWCGQADVSVAENSLNLYKSMPRGKLYEGIKISKAKSCKKLGYELSTGEDACYPGLETFYRNEEEKKKFIFEFFKSIYEFGDGKNISMDDMAMLDACECKDGSPAKTFWGDNCTRADQLQSLFKPKVIRTFLSKNKMWCGQAEAHVAEDALNLYKSMPRGKLYDGITVSDTKSCAELGYKFELGEDPCYPGLHSFCENEEQTNQFLNDFQVTLADFGKKYNFSVNDTTLLDACQCKSSSASIKYWGDSCKKTEKLRALVAGDDATSVTNKRTFFSANKRWCAQGPARIAEGALALYKAMPRGKLYIDSYLQANDAESCESSGYTLTDGEDLCYPGLQVFYRNEEEKKQWGDDYDTLLEDFGHRYNISADVAHLMDSCTCHVDSPVLAYRGKSCNILRDVESSWVHHEPKTGKQLACAGGSFVNATLSLAVLKSSVELPLHQSDQIAPMKCDQRGFPVRFPEEDSCFSGMHAWTKTDNMNTDALNLETKHILEDLLNGGFKNFSLAHGMDDSTRQSNPRCKCAPNSKIGKKSWKTCQSQNARTSIRDWWKE